MNKTFQGLHRKMPEKRHFQNKSLDEKISEAKRRLPKAINHLKSAIITFESNKLLLNSSKIKSQIPKSKAAWIFNALFRSQYHGGLTNEVQHRYLHTHS